MKEEETKHECVVCHTKLTQRSKITSNVPWNQIVDGPGGQGQYDTVVTLYCPQCGLQYMRPPKPSA